MMWDKIHFQHSHIAIYLGSQLLTCFLVYASLGSGWEKKKYIVTNLSKKKKKELIGRLSRGSENY